MTAAGATQDRSAGGHAVAVTFGYDPDTDSVYVLHDGEMAWQEQSWGSFDQYIAHYAPKGVPVLLETAAERAAARSTEEES